MTSKIGRYEDSWNQFGHGGGLMVEGKFDDQSLPPFHDENNIHIGRRSASLSTSSTGTTTTGIRPKGVAILIPVTSSNAFYNLSELVSSFAATTVDVSSSPEEWHFGFFVSLPQHATLKESQIKTLLNKTLGGKNLSYSFAISRQDADDEDSNGKATLSPASRARAIQDLARLAQDEAASSMPSREFDFFVLLRDDVKFKTNGWNHQMVEEFMNIAKETGNPLGFACVSLMDESFPGFPSLPVVHKLVFDMFDGRLFPSYLDNTGLLTTSRASSPTETDASIEQISDETPEAFLFELFFRFNAAKLVPSVRTSRLPRKRTQKDALLRSRFLSKHLKQGLDILSPYSVEMKPFGSMDVVVPSFRATKEVLERILSLPPPKDCAVRFNLVCDNPDCKEARSVFHKLEAENEFNSNVRIRMNPVNVGPGGTRNHGLAESCADYVVFLDDDVLVQRDILVQYWELAKQHPDCAGFIGRTILPPPQTPRQFAVKYAGIAYFWDIAKSTTRDLPWGITANLCVKRHPEIYFYGCETFTRGGGGEDVDFCMRLDSLYRELENDRNNYKCARSFAPAPNAVVHHPYWNNGQCFLKQFFGWTKGDSTLIEVHPKYKFRSLPDFSESFIFLSLVSGILTFLDVTHVLPVLTFLASYVIAEWIYETLCHLDLVKEWGLSFTTLVGLETCIVRTWSEVGRFKGQLERGTLMQGLTWRFDWFQENWPEYRNVERVRAFKRGVFRLAIAGLTTKALFSSSSS